MNIGYLIVMWMVIGAFIYFLDLGYRCIIIKRTREACIVEAILYMVFGFASMLFFMYTVMVHIQRIKQRRKMEKEND